MARPRLTSRLKPLFNVPSDATLAWAAFRMRNPATRLARNNVPSLRRNFNRSQQLTPISDSPFCALKTLQSLKYLLFKVNANRF